MKKISIKLISITVLFVIIFSFFQVFFIESKVNAALSSSYKQYIKSGIENFPESYQRKLAYLKYLHPNWEFKAYYTGISWAEVTSSETENKCMKNTIHKGALLDPAVLCICGKCGDPGYYCASAKTVNYYLDPRNFMGEAMIFQFLDLANGTGITKDIVEKTVANTYLSAYADDIMSAATESGISPIHIVATIFQELGKTGTPRAISGTVEGYESLYNFYNYGATDGEGAVERGLAKARELGWTTPRKALIDGAKMVLANNYVSAGQTTKYFYKFDVVGNEILTEAAGAKTYPRNQFYNHQYMTNLRDPSSQAGTLYDIYANNGILDTKLTFTVPIYDNMPSIVETPTSLTSNDGELYYVNSMKKWGVSLRQGASYSSTSLGNLYKDTVVALISREGLWSKIRIKKIDSYDTKNQVWNYVVQDGYILSEYLTKVGTEVPDYRKEIGLEVDVGKDIGIVGVKASEQKLIMTPNITVTEIRNKYSTATIKKADGADISTTTDAIPTGAIITIENVQYTAVKIGDISSDGKIDSMDMYRIIQYLLGNMTFDSILKTAGDVNLDGKIDSMDMYQIIQYLLGNHQFNV